MFNMTEELNQLIFKYNLDKYYPQYRKRYKAEKILDDIINNIANKREKTFFVSNDKIVLDIVVRNRVFSDEYIHMKHILDIKDMEDIAWEKYDNVYILSMNEAEKYGKWFRTHNVKYVWIYDIFEVEGLVFEKEFYKLLSDNQGNWVGSVFLGKEVLGDKWPVELYFQKMRYKNSLDDIVKKISLEKIFFIAIVMKNFVCAEKYLSSLGGKYLEFWAELQELLNRIKNVIVKRKQKDIVWYWMDAISYEKSEGMSYLNEIMSRSVVFENAYANTPYTFSTFKSILCKKLQVDDKAYKISLVNEDNSELLKFLSSKGYDFRCVSGYLQYLDVNKMSINYRGIYDTSSMICWDTLENIINNPNPMVVLAHFLIEAHAPELSTEMDDDNIGNQMARKELGKKEIDSQLRFYDEFLNENIYRIYMSDHGSEQLSSNFHVHWNVYNKNLAPRKVKGLISTMDLSKVIENIVEDKDVESEIVYRDYIRVQDLDMYSKHCIGYRIKEKVPLNLSVFGYKGVITEKHMYIRYKMGVEWLVERDNIKYEPNIGVLGSETQKMINEVLLRELRDKAGEYIEDAEISEKCKYSVYLYKIYDNYIRRGKEYLDIICEAMKKYPKGTIALRMGGDHSAELYNRLRDEYKEKIGFIIDNNKECVCKKYGLPILTLEEAGNTKIKAIVLSSYNYLDMLRKETKMYPNEIEIIDIYKELEKKGIYCKDTFYVDVQMQDEVYDVGFPFGDLK